MTRYELGQMISAYAAKDEDIRTRLAAATNDTQRAELERLFRLVTIVQGGLLDNLKKPPSAGITARSRATALELLPKRLSKFVASRQSNRQNSRQIQRSIL